MFNRIYYLIIFSGFTELVRNYEYFVINKNELFL